MEPINFFLYKNDVEQLKKIFSMSDDPKFTILSETELEPGFFCVRVFFDSSISLWYTILRVDMYNRHDQECDKIMSDLKQKLEEKCKKLK